MSKRLRAGQRRFPPPRPPAQLAVLLLSLGWLLVASPRAQGKLARAGRAHRELWKPRNPFLSPRSILRGHRQPPGQRELHRGALRTPPHPSRALLALLSPSFPSPRGLPAPWGARPGTPPPGPGAVRAPQAAPGWVQGAGCGVRGAGCGGSFGVWSLFAAGASCPAGEKFARSPAHSKGAQAGSTGCVWSIGLQPGDPFPQPRKSDLALHSSSGAHSGIAGAPGPVLSL